MSKDIVVSATASESVRMVLRSCCRRRQTLPVHRGSPDLGDFSSRAPDLVRDATKRFKQD